MTIAEKVAIVCSACEKSVSVKPTKKGAPRPPRGWKHHRDSYYCKPCWAKLYRIAAVTFPVAEPLEGGTRDEMWSAMRQCWAESTALANWSLNELAKADRPRMPADEKLLKPEPIYLYGIASERYPGWAKWAGCYAAAQSLMHAVEQKYAKRRLEVIWRSSAALPTARYPQPYPVHNDSWKPIWHETTGESGQVMKVPAVRVSFGGRRWLLRLRGGHEMKRQLGSFSKLVSGEAVKGELALYRVGSSQGAHRSGGKEKSAGGGSASRTRLMCKLVAWLPRETRERPRIGPLEVRTARNCLWVAMHGERDRPWLLHANYLRGLIRGYNKRLQALSDDTKAERRRPRRAKRQYQDHMDKIKHRQHCRMKSAIERVGAMLVNYADRCGASAITYNDEERRYCEEFPWAQLRDTVARQADKLGIGFVASGDVAESDDDGGDGANNVAEQT